MSLKGIFKKENKKAVQISERTTKEQKVLKNMTKEDFLKIVVEKVNQAFGDNDLDKKTLEDYAKKLCYEEDLKNNYLNKDSEVVTKYFNMLPKKKKELFVSPNESNIESIQSGELEEDDIVPEKGDFDNLQKTNEKLKIKLVITEISQNKKEKDLRKLLSPFASAFNFHSALIVGPWYLEWTNKELCIPKKIFSSAALLAVDVENDLELADVDHVINVVSDVVCRWNVLHKYSKKENNCQHFVDDLLENLGIDSHLKYTGPLGKVLSNLRTFGEDKIVFKIPDEWREELKIKEQTIFFTTHKELDDFATKVQDAFPEWQTKKYKEEYKLLKSIDRAFWLRHLKDKKKKEYQFINYNPLKESEQQVCNCPFGDPRASRSFGIISSNK